MKNAAFLAQSSLIFSITRSWSQHDQQQDHLLVISQMTHLTHYVGRIFGQIPQENPQDRELFFFHNAEDFMLMYNHYTMSSSSLYVLSVFSLSLPFSAGPVRPPYFQSLGLAVCSYLLEQWPVNQVTGWQHRAKRHILKFSSQLFT